MTEQRSYDAQPSIESVKARIQDQMNQWVRHEFGALALLPQVAYNAGKKIATGFIIEFHQVLTQLQKSQLPHEIDGYTIEYDSVAQLVELEENEGNHGGDSALR